MENENRIIFQVEKVEQQTGIKCDIQSDEDVMILAFALSTVLKEVEGLNECLFKLRIMELTDKDFKKKLQETTVNVPDFNKMLKDIK